VLTKLKKRNKANCKISSVFAERIIIVGCSVDQCLGRWAAVRQPWVRFPPSTPLSAKQLRIIPRRWNLYPALDDTQQAKSNPRMNIVVRKIQKK
jgi:hypothetical protein